MKKSLIALAVLGASGVAMAQSSVTLYGVADAGVGKVKYGAPAGNDANGKNQFIANSTMNNGNSRVGVRGVEDLGGGLKAGFNFETGLDLDNGNADAVFWQRNANMWLGGNWGTVKLGRTLNPTFYGIAAWELTGTANYSVVANTYSFAGAGPRNNSQLSYKTPDMGGFSAEVGYILKSDNADRAKWDLNLIYANGPIGVGLSANKTKGINTNYSLGAKYSFSNFALAASYTNANNAANLRRRGFGIGGSATFGAFALTVDLTRDTKNEWTGKKYTNGVVEGKYALSKRTFVYGAFLRLDGTNNYGIGVRHNF
ncbi:porin [Ottowia testudinis]|uniref:Porin n=1 Tax=Ottowia testudinis TaxID=2816950 RepID=A0A975H3U0_9BURK|nr:porin [Ottowia testudinis]QTD46233.1 porin [Ottowia testudinis]